MARKIPEAELMLLFLGRLVPQGDCLIYPYSVSEDGYGRVHTNGTTYHASKYSYMIVHGEVPKGLEVCHSCDNRLCAKIDHLFLGTHLENIRDMQSKNRGHLGEKCGNAKLNTAEVLEIRKLYSATKTSTRKLGKQFNVSGKTIAAIIRRRTWNHI